MNTDLLSEKKVPDSLRSVSPSYHFVFLLLLFICNLHRMATIDSPEQEASSSLSPCSDHVFLSFRAADTRYGFISHLHTELVREGFFPFREDDEFERGKDIRALLERAIMESKISIVVISRDYASSSWCLDELVRIMERQSHGHHVLPVFYHVDPSDVRKQRGNFAEAFIRHEIYFEIEDGRVQGWRAALKKAGDLRGMVLKDGSESEFIQLIVQQVRLFNIMSRNPVPGSRWKKGKLLGRGTFGHVYLGFNSGSGQMCAIKEVRVVSDDQTSEECLKQLNQEIKLLSQLSHPNIVRYRGSELSEETLSVYLEYVSGGSIHKLLHEYGAFKEPLIQNYTRQIVCGLAYLHGRNIVHRDIKGANILVDPNGDIKLVDFGMAKHITGSSMLSFKGSAYWMAPEVVRNTNGYSLAVDIWSLGCTILEMATSKPPWSQYEGVAAIFKIGNSEDIPDIPDYLSNDAKNFVKLCLQRDPSARPSAAQLLDHPFIRYHATTKDANINITRDAFPYTFHGSRTFLL